MLFSLFLWIFLGFTLLLLFVIASAFLGFIITRVPFVTSPQKEVLRAIQEAGVTSSSVFYDLGSGNGKICFLANETTGTKCVGYELTLWTYLFAKVRLWLMKNSPFSPALSKRELGGVKFHRKNFFKVSWENADFIYSYLYPPLMSRIEEKFIADCRPGSVAIIRDFPLPTLKPFKVLNSGNGHEIYLYKKI